MQAAELKNVACDLALFVCFLFCFCFCFFVFLFFFSILPICPYILSIQIPRENYNVSIHRSADQH